MMESSATYGSASFVVTQKGVNTALGLVVPEKQITIPALSIDGGILGLIKIEGFINLSNYKIKIKKGEGVGEAKISPSFTINYHPSVGKIINKSINISFRTPRFGVLLTHDQSKSFISLYNVDFSLDIFKPEWILEPIWKLFKDATHEFKELIRKAVNSELSQYPIELFDLEDVPELNLGNDKVLKTRLKCDSFEFVDDTLTYKLSVLEK